MHGNKYVKFETNDGSEGRGERMLPGSCDALSWLFAERVSYLPAGKDPPTPATRFPV